MDICFIGSLSLLIMSVFEVNLHLKYYLYKLYDIQFI